MERKMYDIQKINLVSSDEKEDRPVVIVQNDGIIKNGLQPHSTFIEDDNAEN